METGGSEELRLAMGLRRPRDERQVTALDHLELGGRDPVSALEGHPTQCVVLDPQRHGVRAVRGAAGQYSRMRANELLIDRASFPAAPSIASFNVAAR